MTSKAQTMKKSLHQKLSCFKGQHQESENSQDENILLYYILENGFVSNKYSLQLNNKKITQLFKMGFLKKHFPKEDIKTSNKHMKRWLIS